MNFLALSVGSPSPWVAIQNIPTLSSVISWAKLTSFKSISLVIKPTSRPSSANYLANFAAVPYYEP